MNNTNNWSTKKKIIALAFVVLAIVGIILTLLLVQRQQELRSRAEKATVINLLPDSNQVQPGDELALDVVVNPGTNQVGFVTLGITYDPNVFEVTDDAFELDAATGFEIISSGQVVADGEYKVTVSAGSDPTNVIQNTARKLGTFKANVKSDVTSGSYLISIDQEKTIVTSIASQDDLGNVLSSAGYAKVVVGGGICKPNTMTCEWDPAEGATSYHYVITRQDQAGTVLFEEDTTKTSVEFTDPELTEGTSYSYSCKVTPINDCGTGSETEGESQCSRPSVTPIPSIPVETETPTPKSTNTPTPTEEIVETETPSPTTPEETVETPTPTIVVVVTQPGEAKGGVEVVNTPTPTIAETGNPVVYGGIIGGILFVLGGIALLFL